MSPYENQRKILFHKLKTKHPKPITVKETTIIKYSKKKKIISSELKKKKAYLRKDIIIITGLSFFHSSFSHQKYRRKHQKINLFFYASTPSSYHQEVGQTTPARSRGCSSQKSFNPKDKEKLLPLTMTYLLFSQSSHLRKQ